MVDIIFTYMFYTHNENNLYLIAIIYAYRNTTKNIESSNAYI